MKGSVRFSKTLKVTSTQEFFHCRLTPAPREGILQVLSVWPEQERLVEVTYAEAENA